jgi:hypothetical protein
MKATKLELQQINSRLAADNQFLREKLSQLNTDLEFTRTVLINTQRKLEDADIRCKKLIASRNHGNPERRALMEQARALAVKTGQNVSTRDLARARAEVGGSGDQA